MNSQIVLLGLCIWILIGCGLALVYRKDLAETINESLSYNVLIKTLALFYVVPIMMITPIFVCFHKIKRVLKDE